MSTGFWAGLAEYFATPDLKKCTPGYVCSAVSFFDGITLPDIVTTLTITYTVVLLIGALPGLWKTWDFLRERWKSRKDKDSDEGK